MHFWVFLYFFVLMCFLCRVFFEGHIASPPPCRRGSDLLAFQTKQSLVSPGHGAAAAAGGERRGQGAERRGPRPERCAAAAAGRPGRGAGPRPRAGAAGPVTRRPSAGVCRVATVAGRAASGISVPRIRAPVAVSMC